MRVPAGAIKRLAASALIASVVLSFGPAASADDLKLSEKYQAKDGGYVPEYFSVASERRYLYVLREYQRAGYAPARAGETVLASGGAMAPGGPAAKVKRGGDDCALSDSEGRWLEWTVGVAVAGLYELDVEYDIDEGSLINPIRRLYIDGESPYAEAENLTFYRLWRDRDDEIRYDGHGNEIRPVPAEIPGWKNGSIRDTEGLYSDPLLFRFDEGEHTIRIEYVNAPMYIKSVTLRAPDAVKSYDEVKSSYSAYGRAEEPVEFGAQTGIVSKNDACLRTENNSDPLVEPHSFDVTLLNVFGGEYWGIGGQSVTWEFYVPRAGLYKLGMRVLQNMSSGLPSFRRIEIDGRLPFDELRAYPFKFGNDWRIETLSGGGEPFEFYLTEGSHSITMTATLEPLCGAILSVKSDLDMISDLYRKLIMMTGATPDPNYVYELDRRIPNLLDDLSHLSASLKGKAVFLDEMSGETQAVSSAMNVIASQLDRMVGKPDDITRQYDLFPMMQNTLGTWYNGIQSIPLAVDCFRLAEAGARWPSGRAGGWSKLMTFFAEFYHSFVRDYSTIGTTLEGREPRETIDVWLAWGSEWCEMFRQLAQSTFTPDTGIAININMVPINNQDTASGTVNVLILSINSGTAPDVAMGLWGASPVEYGYRDGAYDLTRFADFEDVASRFVRSTIDSLTYEGGVYGMPETMTFFAQFYRKDVLSELGIPVPETFEQLYEATLPALTQYNMKYFMPQDYHMFLFQNGGTWYSDGGYRSALDSPEAYAAFKEMCEIYTAYGQEIQADFYNRFRSGEMPIGIGNFDVYMRLLTAAPELAGKWGLAPVPGHVLGDEVDHSTGSVLLMSNMMLGGTKKADSSWDLLKWWSSAGVQEIFGGYAESFFGPGARWATANKEAYLSRWNPDDAAVIRDSWDWSKGIPGVLGGYYSGRNIQFAYTNVFTLNHTPRDALDKAVLDINTEMRRKQEEYGIQVPPGVWGD